MRCARAAAFGGKKIIKTHSEIVSPKAEPTLFSLWSFFKQALRQELACSSLEAAESVHNRALLFHRLIRDTSARDYDGLAIKLGLAMWTSDGYDEITDVQVRSVYADLVALVGYDPLAELEAIDEGRPFLLG